eukprot:COSAG02_NODE_628_length_19343_cov_15.829297_5_plen_79_part_00
MWQDASLMGNYEPLTPVGDLLKSGAQKAAKANPVRVHNTLSLHSKERTPTIYLPERVCCTLTDSSDGRVEPHKKSLRS